MSKVLLVDDEELVRKVLRVVLEAEGHVVVEAGDGSEALAIARSESPDILILDLMMPGIDGLEVCREVKAEQPTTKVLVLTSSHGSEAEDEARRVGADEFMSKPFSALALLDALVQLGAER